MTAERPQSTVDIERNLTPREVVAQLDRYIVGQPDAKRAMAIAIRNRWRRQQLDDDMRREVMPKNILMIGPTGVGKTEIARRVAKIVEAPLIKVEATKFTEVGYVGRDVESIIRDLVDISVNMIHNERLDAVHDEATSVAVERLADLLVEQSRGDHNQKGSNGAVAAAEGEVELDVDTRRKREATTKRRNTRQRNRLLDQIQREEIEEETVELEIEQDFDAFMSPVEFAPGVSPEELQDALGEFLDGVAPRRRSRRVSIREAKRILARQEASRLVDFNTVIEAAIARAEESGIVFIDEIDKTINPHEDYGPDVSGEGVQRDLLPIVEGSVVMTRYGPVKTDHMLFVAAGSFHNVRPSDLIPELQGRFPIRVELSSLSEEDLYAILTEPENALTRQYAELLAAEQVTLEFAEEGLRSIARFAFDVNAQTEDIGARRLHTIFERVLEEISFEAPDKAGERITIGADYVQARLGEITSDEELSNFIL